MHLNFTVIVCPATGPVDLKVISESLFETCVLGNKFDNVINGQGQPSVIISTNVVVLE